MVLNFCGDDCKSQEKLKRTLMQICGEDTKSIVFLNKAYVQSFKHSDTCALTFFMSFCRLMCAMQAPVKRGCPLAKASTPKAFDNFSPLLRRVAFVI